MGCLNTYINTEFSNNETSLSVFIRTVSLFKNMLLQCVKIASLPATAVPIECFESSSVKFPRKVLVIWIRKLLELKLAGVPPTGPTKTSQSSSAGPSYWPELQDLLSHPLLQDKHNDTRLHLYLELCFWLFVFAFPLGLPGAVSLFEPRFHNCIWSI